MSRKTRRKIKRRKRKGKSRKRKSWFFAWSNKPISNRFTRLHTWAILLVDTLFLLVCAYWAYFEICIRKY